MARSDREQLLEDGPWFGQADSGVYQPGKLRQAVNIYPLDRTEGEGHTGRPGWYQLGATLPGRVQGFVQFNAAGVGEMTVTVSAGRLFYLLPSSTTWTEPFTTANLTTAGITLSAGSPTNIRVAFLLTYVGGVARLMVSDGINKPFLWDGSPGVGSLTAMPNVPVLYGQPTIYESRVFGIKNADRLTMVWSETDNPLIGYDIAGGYGDSWSFRQTDNRALTALVGSNSGLLVYRARSTSSAYGDVGPSFSSASTKDAISGDIGTSFPWSVITSGTSVFFLDDDCKPRLHRQGGQGFVPLWHDIRKSVDTAFSNMNPEWGQAVAFPPLECVFFLVPLSAGSAPDSFWMVSTAGPTPSVVSVWSMAFGTNPTCIGTAQRLISNRFRQVLIIGDDAGHVYALSDPTTGTVWDDQWAYGTVAIAHTLETGELGYSTKREKIFDRVDLACDSPTAMTLNVSLTAPDMAQAAEAVTVTTTADDTHAAVGTNASGRWARVKVTHAVLGERFLVSGLALTAYAQSVDPSVK